MDSPVPQETPVAERPGPREFIALIALIMATVALAIDSMIPALPAIGQSLNVLHDNDRQFVIGAFLIGFGVSQFFIGTLSDRFGRRPVLLISVAGYAIFSLAAAFAPSFELLIAARMAQGAGAAGGRALVVSIVRDRYVGRQMARVMSLAFIVFMAAPVLAPSLGQMILLVAPWRWIFVALAAIGILILLWAGLRLPETLPRERRIAITPAGLGASYAMVLGDRQSNGYTLAGAFINGALMSFIHSVQQIFTDVFRAPGMLSIVFAAVATTMAIGSLINSRLVVRLGMRFIGHWALIGFTLFGGIHLAVALSGHETMIDFALLQAAAMGCFGLAAANFGALAMERVGHVAGTASSLQGAFQTIFGAAIGISVGRQFDGTTIPLYTGFFLCGLAALCTILVTERGRLFHRTPQPA
ncbi:multidrug effflux MFS transporter [Sphingomonas colocasiae]|uniref:Multidrug effflux MFS transporter n=1 Tax=Sphingomonas colocasiae TaxID=1848973 RepID=A0ABS7PXE0_9SPHN|nr:multidrug effflux MFS transporter [Sphingomonas colocasiae]MBY8826028.1 multidrug effflux MFS transporter [Sphingomonas colocasiae]